MLELMELIKELETKYGAKVRFYIGLSDDGQSLLIRDVVDATQSGRYCKYHPSTGGGMVSEIFEDGKEAAIEKTQALLRAIRQHYEDLFDNGGISEGSVGEWGFCDETFKTFNVTLWNEYESVSKKCQDTD